MLVTWTTFRTRRSVPAAPWEPAGATWWQGGHSGAGYVDEPLPDGCWWSVLATWDGRPAAEVGPPPQPDVDAWHVVLEPASCSGDLVLAGGARPFEGLPATGRPEGLAAVVTVAGGSPDAAREREFFRRFLHLGRSVRQAPGQLVALLQAREGGPVLTFSVWEDVDAATAWAYEQPQHAGAVARQRAHRLVDASGSVRCRVLSSCGTLGGAGDPLAGLIAARPALRPPARLASPPAR